MSQSLRTFGIFIMPVFKNGRVLRISVPRYVARLLGVGAGDYVTFRQNDAGEIVLGKFNMERLRDEYVQGGSAQLGLCTERTPPPRA